MAECRHYALMNVYSVSGMRLGYECFDCGESVEVEED